MADQKVTEMTELTEAAASDILFVVDDPSGSPVSKKITVTNLLTSGASNIVIPDSGYIGSASDPDALTIMGSGNIGIGTTSPDSYLAGAHGLSIYHGSSPALGLGNSSSNWTNYMNGTSLRWFNGTADALILDGSNLWVDGNVSADSFTDRTPFYGGDALSELMKIKGKDGQIDHSTLPKFARKQHIRNIYEDVEVESKEESTKEIDGKYYKQIKAGEEIEEGRDLGAMISIHDVAFQQLIDIINNQQKEIDELKNKLK